MAGLVILLALVNTGASEPATAITLVAALEMGIPLAAGTAAGALVGRDPVVELHGTLPTPYRRTLLRRFTVTMAAAAVTGLVVSGGLLASGWWTRWPDHHDPLPGQLTWLAPTLALGGLGLLAGALSGSPALAGGLVAAVWIGEQVFKTGAQSNPVLRLVYLFASTRGGPSIAWTQNRLALLLLAALFVGLAWLRLGRVERLAQYGASA
jgi:hypothetical protein